MNVPIVADNASEPDESFRVALGSEANADVTRRQATGTIHNDDDVPGIAVGDVRVGEGAGNADFTVSLSRAGGSPTSVRRPPRTAARSPGAITARSTRP